MYDDSTTLVQAFSSIQLDCSKAFTFIDIHSFKFSGSLTSPQAVPLGLQMSPLSPCKFGTGNIAGMLLPKTPFALSDKKVFQKNSNTGNDRHMHDDSIATTLEQTFINIQLDWIPINVFKVLQLVIMMTRCIMFH